MVTTRSKAKEMEGQLSTILAMLEEQNKIQQMLMVKSDELAEEQRRHGARFDELDKLRENLKGLAETVEERTRRPLPTPRDDGGGGPTARKEPVAPLRPDARTFVPGRGEGAPGERRGSGGEVDVEPMGAGAVRTIRPAPYDGRTAWDAYKTQFMMLAELNAWSDAEKATYLAINLKGSALTVLSNLPEHQRRDFAALTAALDARFGVAHQTELNRVQLRNRRRRREEDLPSLAEDVERLARLAYPGADASMIETLAKDQFIDSLSSPDMQLRLRQLRPTSIRQALQHALELESFVLAGQQSARPVRGTNLEHSSGLDRTSPSTEESLLKKMQECVIAIQDCAKKLESAQTQKRSPPSPVKGRDGVVCYNCQQKGHIRRNCPERRRRRGVDSQNQGNEQ